MITLEKGRYFAAIYFAESKTANFLGVVFRNEGETKFRFMYRFRYYKDEKAFDSEDEKHWYSGEGSEDEQAVCSVFDQILADSNMSGFGPPQKITPRTDDPLIISQMLSHQSWANVRTEKNNA